MILECQIRYVISNINRKEYNNLALETYRSRHTTLALLEKQKENGMDSFGF